MKTPIQFCNHKVGDMIIPPESYSKQVCSGLSCLDKVASMMHYNKLDI